MAAYTVGAVFDALAHQHFTHAATTLPIVGTARTASGTMLFVELEFMHGFIEAAANTNPGFFRVQVTQEGTNNDQWVTVAEFTVFNGTPTSIDPTNAEGAGDTLVETTVTTGATVGGYYYWQDATAVADGEWVTVGNFVAATSITLIDGITNAKAATDLLFSNAEHWTWKLELGGVERYRVCYIHAGAVGADAAFWVRGREVTAIA